MQSPWADGPSLNSDVSRETVLL